jgi:hypothetical protein
MYKIKLLISLLISLIVLSCTSVTAPKNNTKFSLAYVGGEYDGLLLYNNLDSHLMSYDMLDDNSRYEIRSNITHSTGVYVTNIDNTSDRESITSELRLLIYDKKFKCTAYDYRDKIHQFYIFASNEKFVSNKTALKKIKNENTEELVKKVINELMNEKVKCKLKKIKLNSLRNIS